MKSFYIPDLAPLEDFIRTSSLRFLTQVWRNLGSFELISNSPYIRDIDGILYIEDGNHRCVWNLINGIYRLDAEVERFDPEIARITLLTAESARKSGINNVMDLVKLVEDPGQYSMTGPVTHRITPEDLRNPNYFLAI